jgi:hypothetical protein
VEPSLSVALNLKTFEIYKPPYFFKGTRPTITQITSNGSTPKESFDHGDPMFIDYTVASGASITKVGLMRLGAMTHHTDTEQRYVEVSFTAGSTLQCTIPSDPKVLMPGPYMVWIIDDQDRPCDEAPIIDVTVMSDSEGATGGLDIPEGSPTTSSFTYGGSACVITSVDGIEKMLSIDGNMVHVDYFPASETFGSHHKVFGRFDSLTALAEYIIDNDVPLV